MRAVISSSFRVASGASLDPRSRLRAASRVSVTVRNGNDVRMHALLDLFAARLGARWGRQDDGAVGAMVIGIVIGVALVVFGIIKFLIPGE